MKQETKEEVAQESDGNVAKMKQPPQLVSTDSFKKTAVVYDPDNGNIFEVPLIPGLEGFYMAKVATGELLTTTLVCTEGGRHTEEAPEAGPASSLAAPPLDQAEVVQPQEQAEVVDIDELSESEGPLTPTTMSVSYGYAATPAVSVKWGSGVLHTAPVGSDGPGPTASHPHGSAGTRDGSF